jgi:hypothetical protein
MAWHYRQFQRWQTATHRNAYGVAGETRRASVRVRPDTKPVQPQDSDKEPAAAYAWTKTTAVSCSKTYDGPVGANKRVPEFTTGRPNYDEIAEHDRVEYSKALAAENAGILPQSNCP